jgi:hypothetical protein
MSKRQRKQKTAKGCEIPIPKRAPIDAVLKRAAKGSTTRRPPK